MCARIANHVLKILSDLLGHENHEVLVQQLRVKKKVKRKIKDEKGKKGRNRNKYINWLCFPC